MIDIKFFHSFSDINQQLEYNGQIEEKYDEYNLLNQPKFVLWKPTNISRLNETISLFRQNQCNVERVGRIKEIFDIASLEEKIQNQKFGLFKNLYKNQFLELFRYYVSSLYCELGLSVHMPVKISPLGEWAIWPKGEIKPLKEGLLTQTIIEEIFQHFRIERVWKIDLLKEHSNRRAEFCIFQDHVFLTETQLPSFFDQESRYELDKRHQTYLSKFQLNSTLQKTSEEQKAKIRQEETQLENILKIIKQLIEHNCFFVEDLIEFDPHLIVKMQLLWLIKETYSYKKVSSDDLYLQAQKMLSALPQLESGIDTEEKRLEKIREKFEEQQRYKQGLKEDLYWRLIENRDKKGALEEQKQTLYSIACEECINLAKKLNEDAKENQKDHFMLFFGNRSLA